MSAKWMYGLLNLVEWKAPEVWFFTDPGDTVITPVTGVNKQINKAANMSLAYFKSWELTFHK